MNCWHSLAESVSRVRTWWYFTSVSASKFSEMFKFLHHWSWTWVQPLQFNLTHPQQTHHKGCQTTLEIRNGYELLSYENILKITEYTTLNLSSAFVLWILVSICFMTSFPLSPIQRLNVSFRSNASTRLSGLTDREQEEHWKKEKVMWRIKPQKTERWEE